MNAVGIVSIAFGVLTILGRSVPLVAPAPSLRWFRNVVATDRGLRKLGAFILVLGVTLIWAGFAQESGLAQILFYVGICIVGASTLLLLVFPSLYRGLVDSMMPEDTDGVLLFARLKGLSGIVIGVLFIYYGALAI